ncbi:hypothetical protein P691DRAFT_770315 [Macrolepiota fuliginosa MF-IS2]|uniref:Uncharacterized protein n=1 Tax=Macrolepiota fuliginosa MF-IS2 TaxID=1400762 RepID=A0A9P6CB75_9AGAR|nr:hypothetical protein P691DRAFT_770315 [Macrolepiota fuliginosa MF-IS2]
MSFKLPGQNPRPPLITPSASPPPQSWSVRNDAAPPCKRQRVASVSRSSSTSTRLSVSAAESTLDIQKEREASRVRLLDAWSQLAERYSRRLDEDDIVDIRTGEIVKDNGFLRATRKHNFGEALAPEVVGGDGGYDSQAEEVSEEEGADELDALPEEHDLLEDIFTKSLRPSPSTVQNGGSGDRNDLEEFLVAEKRRKEEYGSDVGEEELDLPPIARGREVLSPSPVADDGFSDDDEDCSVHERPPTSSSVYESAREESLSGDELDNWEPTEATMVVLTNDEQHSPPDEESEYESEIEIIESPAPPHKAAQHEKKRTPPAQLQTPPNSHSDTNPPYTMPSPPRLPSPQLPIDIPPAQRIKDNTTSSLKSRTKVPKVQPPPLRAPTPEVIDITDSENEDPAPGLIQTSYSPSPSPPPPPSPPVRARSRAQSIVPQVVISTLPPRLAQSKDTSSGPKSQSNSPVKRVKKSLPELLPKTSPAKKPTPKPKSPQLPKKSHKATGSKSANGLGPHKIQPEPLDEGRDAFGGGSPVVNFRKFNPEIRERHITPVLPADKPPRPRTGETLPTSRTQTSHKRKRSSSEHEPNISPKAPEKGTAITKPRKSAAGRTSNNSSQRSLSKPKHASPSDEDGDSISDTEQDQRHHAPRRFASASASSSTQSHYTPHTTPMHHSGTYLPFGDPRVHEILADTMQRLAALHWAPTHPGPSGQVHPYTPTHQRFSSVGPNFMYSTPDHLHPYPFSYDPSFSKATLPPSSPEPPSSPVRPRERRKSLVTRSRSRGRTVSFRIEKGESQSESEEEPKSLLSETLKAASSRHQAQDRSRSPRPSRGKGKAKAIVQHSSTSGSESESDHSSEEEKPTRARTPGPEPRRKERAMPISVPSSSSSRPRPSKKSS